MTDKIKVVVYVDKGNVPSAYASLPDTEIDVEIIDADNLEAEGMNNLEIDAILTAATDFLYPVY